MANKTDLGYEIIPIELVGKDASLEKGIYNDSYLSEYRSANAKLWQPKIINVGALTDIQIKTAEVYLESVRKTSPTDNKGKIDAGTIFGIAVAQRGGFALPTKYENNVIVLPSQRFIEYCVGCGK